MSDSRMMCLICYMKRNKAICDCAGPGRPLLDPFFFFYFLLKKFMGPSLLSRFFFLIKAHSGELTNPDSETIDDLLASIEPQQLKSLVNKAADEVLGNFKVCQVFCISCFFFPVGATTEYTPNFKILPHLSDFATKSNMRCGKFCAALCFPMFDNFLSLFLSVFLLFRLKLKQD